MATAFTKGDSLGIYATESGTTTQVFLLGGRRAAFETGVFPLINKPIPPVVIQQVSGELGEGTHIISGDTDTLTFKAQGDTTGTAVTVNAGETKLLESNDTDKWVRVYRDNDYSTDSLGGYMELDIRRSYQNAIALSNIDVSASAKVNSYRAFMLSNHNKTNEEITNLKVYVGTLGIQQTSDSAQLGASGSGTITTAGDFSGWAETGWCHIKTSGGTTREIVYYESRTNTSLTIPATGRGLLGTSAAAGAATDTLDSVPGIRIASETEDANGEIQTVSLGSAPTSVTWDTGTTNSTGLSKADLQPLENLGIWVHTEIPQAAKAQVNCKSIIYMEYDVGGTTYTNSFWGYYDIGDTSIAGYELYVGEDAAPDLTATPDDTGTGAFSLTYVVTPPGAGTKDVNFTVLERNKYNLVSQNYYYDTKTINSSGTDVTATVSAPTDVTLENYGAGIVRLKAKSRQSVDSTAPTAWRIYSTTTGTDPDPAVDTPTDVLVTNTTYSIPSYTDSSYNLTYDFPAGAWGEDRRVLLRMYESGAGAESDNTTVLQAIVDTTTPVPPSNFLIGMKGGDIRGAVPQSFTVGASDYGTGVEHTVYNFQKKLFSASNIIWRIFTHDKNQAGIYTDYEFNDTAHSAAGSADDIEIVSANEIYINVNSVRRCKIDVSNKRIEAASFEFGATMSDDVLTPNDTFSTSTETYLLAYDAGRGLMRPVMEVTSAGACKFAIDFIQKRS